MQKKDSKTNLLEHSEAKVELLGEYLKRYLGVISNDKITKIIEIYDVFCGEGIYKDGGHGSPLVILKQIKDLFYTYKAKNKKIPKIACHFNDLDTNKIQKLKDIIAMKSLQNEDYVDIKFTSNDYQTKYQEILIELNKKVNKSEKYFIFIDPYQYKHIKAHQIRDLMNIGYTEVLLWLPTQFMYRFESNGTPEALQDFIEEITLFKEWKKSDNVWSFIKQLKDGFQKYLNNIFVDTFTIEKDPRTVFCLFFFSSHIKGFEKMLEAKWKIDSEQGKGWDYMGNQPSLFHAQKTNPLEDALQKFLLATQRYNGEVYEFTLRQGFLPTHTNEILRNWQNSGKLSVFNANGKEARKNSFYISYKYYKEEKNKVIFKLK